MKFSREMLCSYLETALWSSNDESDESGGEPMDANYSIDDVAFGTLLQAARDLRDFCREAGDLLEGLDASRVAHDFWLTRNGHGAGFWDGDYEKSVGRELTRISKDFGGVDLLVGDDGRIHSF